MQKKQKVFDTVIIGGGFYGTMLALHFQKKGQQVLVIEKEKKLLTKASYNNQARVHNGYHYPRSFITALRSHLNYKKFIKDFKPAISDKFLMHYAIANINSKTTSRQFVRMCKQIGAPLKSASPFIKSLLNPKLIEEVFVVEEIVFDAAKLREIMTQKLKAARIPVLFKSSVINVSQDLDKNLILTLSNDKKILCKQAFNCTYASINSILTKSKLPVLPFKYELTEMPLIKMPDGLENIGLTLMDGPFFSIMPFPDKKMHTIHHVRYTPLKSWTSKDRSPKITPPYPSAFSYIQRDLQRYMPCLKDIKHKGSLYEVKTVLLQNEAGDGRPILYKKDYGLSNFHVVMGGKIDNIYDILEEID